MQLKKFDHKDFGWEAPESSVAQEVDQEAVHARCCGNDCGEAIVCWNLDAIDIGYESVHTQRRKHSVIGGLNPAVSHSVQNEARLVCSVAGCCVCVQVLANKLCSALVDLFKKGGDSRTAYEPQLTFVRFFAFGHETLR